MSDAFSCWLPPLLPTLYVSLMELAAGGSTNQSIFVCLYHVWTFSNVRYNAKQILALLNFSI